MIAPRAAGPAITTMPATSYNTDGQSCRIGRTADDRPPPAHRPSACRPGRQRSPAGAATAPGRGFPGRPQAAPRAAGGRCRAPGQANSHPEGVLILLTLARLVTAALLIASAAAFATGAAIEHHTASSQSQPARQHAEADRPTSAAAAPGEHPESAEPAGSHRDRGQPEAGREGSAAQAAEQDSETLIGINPEATGLVVFAAVLSLLLAALIQTVGSPLLAAGVALAMLAFTALDIRELTHQLHESRAGLATLAATIALLHLLAAAAALRAARDTRRQPGARTAG